MTDTYWLPEWWDLPPKARRLYTLSKMERPQGAVAPAQPAPQPPTAQEVTIHGNGGHGGSPPGPPPAAAAAVQLTDAELAEIKRRKRQSREKRLQR